MDAAKTGQLIAALRKEMNLTQKDLAERLQVTDKAVSRWETGKGFPDTALLEPLAAALEISVGELLAGERLSPAAKEDPALLQQTTDRLLVETLRYTGSAFSGAGWWALLAVGSLLLLSPLFTAGYSFSPLALGLGLLALALFGLILRKRGVAVLRRRDASAGAALLCGLTALGLELLPGSAVLVFAAGPTERLKEYFSCFDLTPVGYANVFPFLTGVLTLALLLCLLVLLCLRRPAKGLRRAALILAGIGMVFSLLPLLFGPDFIAFPGIAITFLLAGAGVFLAFSGGAQQ